MLSLSIAIPEQTATGKEISNPFMAGSLPKTTKLANLVEHEAPTIVTTSDEQTYPISLTEADDFNQEDSSDFDGKL
ncbi:hypothetical protein Tco_0343765 [Tanacetum coccineum]